MEFRLYYRGKLRANSGPEEKHSLRRHFHKQLAVLWDQLPLADHPELRALTPVPHKPNNVEMVGAFQFVPLISARINLVCALDILFLRPEPPGAVVTQAGDLDNRLKTLLDGFKVPHEPTALPSGTVPQDGETPFYTLLQDDALITSLTVTTDRLLEPVAHASEVVLVVRVQTSVTRTTYANIGL